MTLLNEHGQPINPAPDPNAGLYRFSEAEMPPVGAGEFVLSEDYYRGTRSVGSFLPDGRMHVKDLQVIPDAFTAYVKHLRDMWEDKRSKKRPSTQDHLVHVAEVPTSIKRIALETDKGRFLDPNDPEAEKRMTRLYNDLDYRDLRVAGGRV